MNIHIRIDAPSGWKRRILLWALAPIAVMTGAIAHAGVDTSWIAPGQPVSSSKLVGVLTGLDGRLTALEKVATVGILYSYQGNVGSIEDQYGVPGPGATLTIPTVTTGAGTLAFPPGTFSGKPVCTTGGGASATVMAPDLVGLTWSYGSPFSLVCVGPR